MSYSHQVPTAIVGLPAGRAQVLYSLLQRWMVPSLVHKELSDALPLLTSARPQAVLLHVGANPPLALQLARRVRAELPDASLILLTDQDDLHLAREAVKLKLRGLVVLGTDDAELVNLFVRMSEENFDPGQAGAVTCLLGAKGGVGVSALAINLAGCLAQGTEARVVLLDMAPCMGEVGVFLDMDTPYAPGRLIREVHLIDPEYIDASVPRHPWGFFVISQPLIPEAITPLLPDELMQAVRLLQRHFTHVVLDAGGVLSALALTAAMMSDHTLVVATPTLPALVAARRRMELFDARGRAPDSTALLLNRDGLDGHYPVSRVAELAGRAPLACLKNEPALMDEALHTGRLLLDVNPQARLTQGLISLGARLNGQDPTALSPEPPRRRIFGLF